MKLGAYLFFVKDNFLLYSVLIFQSELETYKNMEVNKCAMVYSDLFYHSTHSVKWNTQIVGKESAHLFLSIH